MTREVMEQLASLELQVAQMLSPGNMTLQPAQGALSKKKCGRVAWRNADCLMPGVQPSRSMRPPRCRYGIHGSEKCSARILSLNPNNVLLDVIGWTIVQMLGWAAHPLLGYVRLGGEVHSRLSAPPFCLAATEALFGEPATATLLATHLPARHRMQANSILSFVTKSFSQMMRASTSALSLGHEGDLDHTRNVTLRLWPKDSL
ncbi:hypothetical protein HPB51_022635 [Rhipicephalus microplus]|uniref:Uncharacterized protein n=1 Tax=Rhipicephalus microplus TaxID=6941 RepID=A0A9J6ECT8_RHIMP|nr:hypothetical protein HPB51_022635 [Rhipicephalus microplus]